MGDKLWRPQLLSALGAGFHNDKTLVDGAHLRWQIAPQLGLPHTRANGQPSGIFQISSLQAGLPSIETISLFSSRQAQRYPVRTLSDAGGESAIDSSYAGGLRFLRRSTSAISAQIVAILNLLNQFRERLLSPADQDFLSYLRETLQMLRVDLYEPDARYEVGEICALDLLCSPPAEWELPVDQIRQPYLWIYGHDRQGRLIDTDWVGPQRSSSGAPATFKKHARLRATSIYSVRIIPVQGMPELLAVPRWIFSEEYCRANIWEPRQVRSFQADDQAYSAAYVQQLYSPFKKAISLSQARADLISQVIRAPQVRELLAAPDSYAMYRFQVALQPPADRVSRSATMQTGVALPLLHSLLASAVDPAMASLLGLYQHFPAPHASASDYMVELYGGFFMPANLQRLQARLNQLASLQGLSMGTLLQRLGTPPDMGPPSPEQMSQPGLAAPTALCSLALNLRVSYKSAPREPGIFETRVTAIDLPSNEQPDAVDLEVSSRIRLDSLPFSPLPYQTPVAYELKRRRAGGAWQNVSEADGEATALDRMGIVPPITIPAESDQGLELRDDFRLPAINRSPVGEQTVQYQVTGFDIFGRPSAPRNGSVEPIPVRCAPPLAPGELTAQVVREGQALVLALSFRLSPFTPPLHARPELLEITVHRIAPAAEAPAGQVRWSGARPALLLSAGYRSQGSLLDSSGLRSACAQLRWGGDELSWQPAPSADCEVLFPDDAPQLVAEQLSTEPAGAQRWRRYELRLVVGYEDALPPGPHRWCARLRVRGRCPFDGAPLDSPEATIGARTSIAPPRPEVVQPPLTYVPESSYADKLGDAYYSLDLHDFLPAAARADHASVQIYHATLDRLTSSPGEVADGLFFAATPEDPDAGKRALVRVGRADKQRFERLTSRPLRYAAETRFYPIKVRGDLEQYHVIGLIGCNAQLDERPWGQAGIILFKTPSPVLMPLLTLTSARAALDGGQPRARLEFQAGFIGPPPGRPAETRLQVLRHDLSTGQRRLLAESAGMWDPQAGCYRFNLDDGNIQPWRRYRYQATLLCRSAKHGDSFIKAPRTAEALLLAPAPAGAAPIGEHTAASATILSGGGVELRFTLAAGEYDCIIAKLSDGQGTRRWQGQIAQGRARLEGATLAIDRQSGQYTLTLHDPDDQPGLYTLRLSQGQQPPWVRNVRTQ